MHRAINIHTCEVLYCSGCLKKRSGYGNKSR